MGPVQAGPAAAALRGFGLVSGAPRVRMVRLLNSMVSESSVSLVTRTAAAPLSAMTSSAVVIACLRSSVAISSVQGAGAVRRMKTS